MNGQEKTQVICVTSICVTIVLIGVLIMSTSIINHKNAFENGYIEKMEPDTYTKVWRMVNFDKD